MLLVNENKILFENGNVNSISKIPLGVWQLDYNQMKQEFFLNKKEFFKMPEKLYGGVNGDAERFLNTFAKIDSNLGVGLVGLKGSGKSLTAKQTCVLSQDYLPVIIIDECHTGSQFNNLISSINQECIVFIDEFEKIYHSKELQNELLSILDGVFMGKKLFLFTSNESSKFSNYLANRPSRIHYLIEYENLNINILEEILDDKLKNKSFKKEFKELYYTIGNMNIDMVFSLIRECNMYNESPKTAVKYLNISLDGDVRYNVSVKRLEDDIVFKSYLSFRNPLAYGRVHLHEQFYKDVKDEEGIYLGSFDIEPFEVTQKDDTIVLTNSEYEFTYTKTEKYRYDF